MVPLGYTQQQQQPPALPPPLEGVGESITWMSFGAASLVLGILNIFVFTEDLRMAKGKIGWLLP